MKTSERGIALIGEFEGYRGEAYLCPSGVPTIGYGHTKNVQMGDTCTAGQADEWLRDDIKTAENAVNSYMDLYGFSQNEYDALVSFTFNCGKGNLDKLLSKGKRSTDEIAKYLPQYNKSNGKALEGLKRRRKAELELFLSPSEVTESVPLSCDYYPKYTGDSNLIEEVFRWIGARNDYDFAFREPWKQRKRIAKANGIQIYSGTASQNLLLIRYAKEGVLRKP